MLVGPELYTQTVTTVESTTARSSLNETSDETRYSEMALAISDKWVFLQSGAPQLCLFAYKHH